MTTTTERVNIYSDMDEPTGGGPSPDAWDRKLEEWRRVLTPDTIEKAIAHSRGSLTFRTIGKDQIFTINIVNKWDDIVIAGIMLTDTPARTFNTQRYRNAARLIRETQPTDDSIYRIMNSRGMTYDPSLTTKKGKQAIENPNSGRTIFTGGKTYKKLFGDIQLRNVTIQPEYVFKTVDYKVDEYCVPSYLKKYLTKKQYKLIESDLTETPTPTYPQLTKILNSLNIGLNVYIADKECIQKQEGNKKDLNILVRDNHMYVLYKTLFTKTKATDITYEEFEKLKQKDDVSQYTNNSMIYEGKKLNIKYDDTIKRHLDYTGPTSTFNIKFFDDCKIRPTKYFNPKIEHINGVDLNACYVNILRNESYKFPISNGFEITTKYKDGELNDTSFYYVKFKNPSDEVRAIFGHEGWVMGYILLNLNLKYTVKYEHIVNDECHGSNFAYKKKGKLYIDLKAADEGTETELPIYEYMDIIRATGNYASYISTSKTQYNCKGTEKEAMRDKYYDECCINMEGVKVLSDQYKKKTSLYAYLAIVSYSKYQLYLVNQEIKKMYNTVKIAKLQTDYIGFNIDITAHDIMTLNKAFEGHGFILKQEYSKKSFNHTPFVSPHVSTQKKELKTYNKEKIVDLLDKNKSFFLTGRGGYGKTYTIKNTIIPHLEMTDKTHILSSTTKANAKEIGGEECKAIQTLLFKKDNSLERLEKYFEKIDYLIIDEASQMTLDVMTTLNHLKESIGLNIIASGDINQCSSADSTESWLHSYPFKHMVDHKFIKLEWRENGRYSKEYDEFLDSILKCNTKKDRVKLIKKEFKGSQTIRDGNEKQKYKNLVYTHDKGKTMEAYKTIGKDAYKTIHSVQGESIDEIHNIYEIEKMPKDVLYTALSRTTKKENIRIILKK
jgi:hypothetical protein